MANGETQATPAVEGAARKRRALRNALYALEEAISSHANSTDEWRLAVKEKLDGLDGAFQDHVDETERTGGLYDEMEEMTHVVSKARRLREDHPSIRRALDEQLERFADPFPADADLGQIRDDVQRLMGRVVRHRQAGSDLVWEAYAVDIGTAG